MSISKSAYLCSNEVPGIVDKTQQEANCCNPPEHTKIENKHLPFTYFCRLGMWQQSGIFIIRKRVWLIAAIVVLTGFAIYHTSKVQLSYDFAKVVPADDPDYTDYLQFKKMFGEDGNVLVAGVQSAHIFEKDFFNDWYRLTKRIEATNGIEKVVSLGNLYTLRRDDSLHKIEHQTNIDRPFTTQSVVDSFMVSI
jgi:hypothetical protein